MDIKPHVNILESAVKDDRLYVKLTLPAGTELNLNTGVLVDAFCEFAGAKILRIYTKRTKILCKNGDEFI